MRLTRSPLTKGVEALRDTLTDPDISSYRLVVTPERMVIKEAQRAATYLRCSATRSTAWCSTGCCPSEVAGDASWSSWRQMQAGYRQEVHDIFAPLPIWEAPVRAARPGRPRGFEPARARAVWRRRPDERVLPRLTQQMDKDGEGISFAAAAARRDRQSQMTKRGDQLFIEIGNFRRDMILPLMLSNREATGAVFRRDGTLE